MTHCGMRNVGDRTSFRRLKIRKTTDDVLVDGVIKRQVKSTTTTTIPGHDAASIGPSTSTRHRFRLLHSAAGSPPFKTFSSSVLRHCRRTRPLLFLSSFRPSVAEIIVFLTGAVAAAAAAATARDKDARKS